MSLLFFPRRLKLSLPPSSWRLSTPSTSCTGYSCFKRFNSSTISSELQTGIPTPDPPPNSPSPNSSLPTFVPSGFALEAYAVSSSSLAVQPTLDIPPATDPLLNYISTTIMRHGKRHEATRRVSRILLHLYALTRTQPLPLLRQAIELASPSIRVVSHKTGGKVIQRPKPLSERQRVFWGIRWIIEACGKKKVQEVAKRKVVVRPKGKLEERFARVVVALLTADTNNPDGHPVLAKKAAMHKLGMVNRCVHLVNPWAASNS